MAVNLRRGLLRFWLVANVLWVLLAGGLGYSIILREPVNKLWECDFNEQASAKIAENLFGNVQSSPIIAELADCTEVELEMEDSLEAIVEKIEKALRERRENALSKIQDAWWLALILVIPPLVVLFLGYLAAWIVRGFRQA